MQPVVSVQADTHKLVTAIRERTGPLEDILSLQLIKAYPLVFLNKQELNDSHKLPQLLHVHCYSKIAITKLGTQGLLNSPCTVVAFSNSQFFPSKEGTRLAMVPVTDKPYSICKTKATIGEINWPSTVSEVRSFLRVMDQLVECLRLSPRLLLCLRQLLCPNNKPLWHQLQHLKLSLPLLQLPQLLQLIPLNQLPSTHLVKVNATTTRKVCRSPS